VIAAPTESDGETTEVAAVATSGGGASAEVRVQHVNEAASPSHTPVWDTHIDAAKHALEGANAAIRVHKGTCEMVKECRHTYDRSRRWSWSIRLTRSDCV